MLQPNARFILATVLILILAVVPTFAEQDSDGDGVIDRNDSCPTQAGPSSNNGCPFGFAPPPPSNPDTDGDGLPDSDDACPTLAGPRENQGCPTGDPNNPPNNPPPNNPDPNDPPSSDPGRDTTDTDGDGWYDEDDRCPTVPGTSANSGCPDDDTPPFNPPSLPTDACYVTVSGDYLGRVRLLPSIESTHIGHLIPGVIYLAEGLIDTPEGDWLKLTGDFQHLDLEQWGGSDGYVSVNVVNFSYCAYLDPTPFSSADDLASDQPELCHLNVGYDAASWSDDPTVPNYVYASFWFEAAAGTPIVVGTPHWGVIYIADFLTPQDVVNGVAMTTPPGIIQEAIDSGQLGAYNFPTEAGGMDFGSWQLYRLTGEAGGNCGPIVGEFSPPITSNPSNDDGQVVVVDQPIDEYACTVVTAFNWIFAFNYAPGDNIPLGTQPLAIINGDVENYGDVNLWASDMKNLNDEAVEYMSFGTLGEAGYMSYPRTGGDCGRIGEPSIAILRADDQRYEPIGVSVQTVFIIETLGADCNNNGIDDLDEFWPPDCMGLTTGDNGSSEAPEETLDEVMEWIDLVCGGKAWIISLGTNDDGEVIVTNAQCLD